MGVRKGAWKRVQRASGRSRRDYQRVIDASGPRKIAGGHLIIGVPVEIGFPALYKGLFRMWRRFGAFEASWRDVWDCVAHRPPKHL
jgi:hypothetical protein